MTLELEHKKGLEDWEIKAREHEFKKECIRKKFGWSKEKFNDMLNDVKGFFELNKKQIKIK